MKLEIKKCLGVFQLVMIAIVSVDSLRNLPIGAQYGLSLVTFYVFAGFTFFLPLAWIASQLAVRYPNIGGSYLWIEAAFGKKWGNLSIWLQWTYNVIWYPTIFVFIATTMLSLIKPGEENNTLLLLVVCAVLFWLMTFVHSHGVKVSSWMSTISAIVGTLLPMSLIVGVSIYWLITGSPSATPLAWQKLIPDAETLNNAAYFSNILFSLLGLEVIAMHAGNVINPARDYPRALFISATIILLSLILSSLALCVIIPSHKIGLISGIMDVFQLFFNNYHFPLGAHLVGWCIVLGGLGIAASWMIGVARGLHVALMSTNVPPRLLKLNKNGVPQNVLYLQGIVYTLLLSAFILLPNVNNSYWLLSALSAQFALLYYVLLFTAAAKLLRSQRQNRTQALASVLLPIIAGLVSLIGIFVGFVPPSNVNPSHVYQYEFFMIGSLLVFCMLPFLLRKKLA